MPRLSKQERREKLLDLINRNPFMTDEELASFFQVSVQTIRLDRMGLSIPELRERIKSVAEQNYDEVKALLVDEVIGEIIDLQLDTSAISILDIKEEHVFSRNKIARGHHLFAQANSLAVAVINDELALTATANIQFIRQVRLDERVVAKAKVRGIEEGRTIVEITSYVGEEPVFSGTFAVYRSTLQVHSNNEKHHS